MTATVGPVDYLGDRMDQVRRLARIEGIPDRVVDQLTEVICEVLRGACRVERERCAKVAESCGAHEAAADIRKGIL